jgi:hypothetical protein
MSHNQLVKATRNALATRKQSTELAPGFRKGAEIILADKSGSMRTRLPNSNQTRIDALNQAISSYGPDIQTIAFSHLVECVLGQTKLVPEGSTAMDRAFQAAWKYEPNYLLVISDGAVDDPNETINQAKRFTETTIIDTLYIGEDNPAAEELMKRLAEIGHGRFRRYDMSKPQTLQLESVIKGLLPPPSGGGISL